MEAVAECTWWCEQTSRRIDTRTSAAQTPLLARITHPNFICLLFRRSHELWDQGENWVKADEERTHNLRTTGAPLQANEPNSRNRSRDALEATRQ